MKILLAPNKDAVGTGTLDFCHTTPGELLVVSSSRCSKGTVEDECGCHRSMTGTQSKKGTTIGIVAEMPEGEVMKWVKHRSDNYYSKIDGASDELKNHLTAWTMRELKLIADDISEIPVGSRVGFAFTNSTIDIFRAGERKKHGV
jgi:hypothetical protein